MKEDFLNLYNHHYNIQCAGLPHGGPISMQELQAMALSAMLNTLKHAGSDYISAQHVEIIIDGLTEQGKESIVPHIEVAQ
jgi:hypothetical protein